MKRKEMDFADIYATIFNLIYKINFDIIPLDQ